MKDAGVGRVKYRCFLPQHAHALELLKDQLVEGAKALDVGSGSGYLTACFARMVSRMETESKSFFFFFFLAKKSTCKVYLLKEQMMLCI